MPDRYPPLVLQPNSPGSCRRTWVKPAQAHERVADPRLAVLIPCCSCERRGTLKVWHVRRVKGRGSLLGEPYGDWNTSRAECADREDCSAFCAELRRKQEEQRKRRSPDLPHPDAPAGSCKWCGEKIVFNEDKKGWKRRRSRNYHRGDEWEIDDGQPRDCLTRARAWRSPKAATDDLLDRQEGRCTLCERQIAEEKPVPEHWKVSSDWSDRDTYWSLYTEEVKAPSWSTAETVKRPIAVDVDHVDPIWNGGTNALENLQVICRQPCHKEKTAREAKMRAKMRRTDDPTPEAPETAQMELGCS